MARRGAHDPDAGGRFHRATGAPVASCAEDSPSGLWRSLGKRVGLTALRGSNPLSSAVLTGLASLRSVQAAMARRTSNSRGLQQLLEAGEVLGRRPAHGPLHHRRTDAREAAGV